MAKTELTNITKSLLLAGLLAGPLIARLRTLLTEAAPEPNAAAFQDLARNAVSQA